MTDEEKRELKERVIYCKRLGLNKQEAVAKIKQQGFKPSTIKSYWDVDWDIGEVKK